MRTQIFGLLVTLVVVGGIGIGSAYAAYPSNDSYICDWNMPTYSGSALISLQTNPVGSGQFSGTAHYTFQQGQVHAETAVLTNPVSFNHGHTVRWRYHQPASNITCDLLVIGYGKELVWGNCSHGGRQRCVRRRPIYYARANANGCSHCASEPNWWRQTKCYSSCTTNNVVDTLGEEGEELVEETEENCTKDLVSLFRCFIIYNSMLGDPDAPDGFWDFGTHNVGTPCVESGQCSSTNSGFSVCFQGTCQSVN